MCEKLVDLDENKNHVEEEDDLSYFDKLDDLEGDEIFSKFTSQSPVDFSELEQCTDDEMSSILMQEMDDSVEGHVPRTSPTMSAKELPADFKNPRKKQSKSALKESAILNPRRSTRIKLRHASATKSENTRRLEEFLLEYKGKSSQAQARARATELVTLETKTKYRSNENTNLKELHKTMKNQIPRQYARDNDIRLGIQWLLKMTASNPTMASTPFNPGNSADLLPNIQGYEYSAEAFSGVAGSSWRVARGDEALPRCMTDDDHLPNDSSGNKCLTEGSGKPTDVAPTD